MTDKLPHTHKIDEKLKKGELLDAAVEHNRTVKREFERAKAGETINLSDLMAAKEVLDQEIAKAPPWKRPETGSFGTPLRTHRRFTVTVPLIVEVELATPLANDENPEADRLPIEQIVENDICSTIEGLYGRTSDHQEVMIVGRGVVELDEWEVE
jgi:hypothetical protein